MKYTDHVEHRIKHHSEYYCGHVLESGEICQYLSSDTSTFREHLQSGKHKYTETHDLDGIMRGTTHEMKESTRTATTRSTAKCVSPNGNVSLEFLFLSLLQASSDILARKECTRCQELFGRSDINTSRKTHFCPVPVCEYTAGRPFTVKGHLQKKHKWSKEEANGAVIMSGFVTY